ncbi:AAA family ATPase [Vogesella oryzae]|uniref:AAA family ATPase n=1 Tax=Vogesella oryzae TaxID=1735285 RepID=UPI001581E27D|nr:AAA family ATPase [Vogesella oryzae]
MQSVTFANRQLDALILGKPQATRLALACLLAGGHLLIEDVPGVGKTTLAHSLAAVLGLSYRRVQFTSDLLPADVLGSSVFLPADGRFEFRPGPVFSQLLLADEINRASPKVQSALLEAMEEQQVSADGTTHALPAPFFVIATQNPFGQQGTFPLPESQLDRFLMRISLGYPPPEAELKLLQDGDRRQLLPALKPAVSVDELLSLQQRVRALHVSPALAGYVLALLQATRQNEQFVHGLSPRAGLGLLAAAKAWALLEGRDHVLPEDIKAVFVAVVAHRLTPRLPGSSSAALALRLLDHVALA